MSTSVRMHWKSFAFVVREGSRELASEVGRERSSRSIGARSRPLRSNAPDVDLDSSGSGEKEVSLARKEPRGLPSESFSVAS